MESGVLDPTKVIRCSMQNACSVAIFLTSDVVVRGSGGGAGDRRGCWERDGFQRLPAISA